MSKAIIPYVPSPAEKAAALEDVAYEIEQIVELLSPWPSSPSLQQNAWLEATLVHSRQLLDFFEDSNRSKRHGRENDDVLAVDFQFVAASIALDDQFRERLNKDLVHLSYSRQKRRPANKGWDLGKLQPLLERSRDFAEHVVSRWAGALTSAELSRWKALHGRLG
jgi:hypothetical protein